jgi:hypothetical protein
VPGQTALRATSTARQVQVALDASQQSEVAVGDKVLITLPDGRTTSGVVAVVSKVATEAAGAPPTIGVEVTPSDPAATGRWDQAPVQVGITTARVVNATSVPVSALLAQTGGGYAVEVVRDGTAGHLVPVTLGLFDDADGLVQVTHTSLAPGDEVVVASA